MKESARDFVRRMPEIHSLPQIMERINAVIDSPASSAELVGKVVGEDPGVTARLLRLVNSSYFSFPGQIDTISRAVALVGTEQLRDLAVATCVIELFEDVPVEFVSMLSYWRHSLACGLCARAIAAHRSSDDGERLFVAGLLHDIGSVVIFSRGGRKVKRVRQRCESAKDLLHASERSVFGFDHADVGRELLELWRLPSVLREAVDCHHRPKRASRDPIMAATIHVADVIVHSMEIGGNGEHQVPPLDAEAWAALELPDAIIPILMSDVDDSFDAVESAMIGDMGLA